jgi:hypothetical protein
VIYCVVLDIVYPVCMLLTSASIDDAKIQRLKQGLPMVLTGTRTKLLNLMNYETYIRSSVTQPIELS